MQLKSILAAAGSLAVGVVPVHSWAGSLSNTVTITFITVSAAGVPISSWAVGLMALALGAMAFGTFHSKGANRFMAIALGLAIAGSGLVVEKDALALIPNGTFTLINSPDTQETYFNCGKTDTYTNGNGSSINITSVTDNLSLIDATQSTCKAGALVGPNQTCTVVADACLPPG